jgi:hypothetical protein
VRRAGNRFGVTSRESRASSRFPKVERRRSGPRVDPGPGFSGLSRTPVRPPPPRRTHGAGFARRERTRRGRGTTLALDGRQARAATARTAGSAREDRG